MPNRKTIIAGVVLAAGLGLLGVSLWRNAPRSSPSLNTIARPEGSSSDAELSRQVDPTFIEPVLERVTSRSIPNSVPDPGGLERSIRQVLDAYSQHEIAAYLRLMREQGVEPSEQIVANPEGAQDHWQATRSVLATANMDLDRIVVLHTVRQGERQYEQEPPPFFSLRRDEGRRFLNSLSSRATEVAEVRIPGEYPSADGTRFDGDLTIQFTFDPGSKRWVLTEFRMAGVPVGVPIRLPPL